MLANPTAEMGIPPLLSPDYAWYNQEIWKGERLSFGLLSSDDRWAPFGNNEAGWNMEGTAYEKPYPLTGGLLTRPYSPEEAAGIPDSALRYAPFFGAFDNGEIVTDAGSQFLREHPEVYNRILADGIPAESFAAGANEINEHSILRKRGLSAPLPEGAATPGRTDARPAQTGHRGRRRGGRPQVRRGPLAFAPAPIVGAAGRAAWAPGRDRRGAWARRDLW